MTTSQPKGERIATNLRLAREQAGLSQGQVAKAMALHRPSISEIEAGRRKVSAEELAKLAELYGVSVSWLITSETSEESTREVKLQLAARELSKLKPDDLERLLRVLATLRTDEEDEKK